MRGGDGKTRPDRSAEPRGPARRSRARRILRLVALVILAVGIAAIATILLFLTRPAGLRAVLDRSGPLLGGTLEYRSASGRLLDRWRVEGVRFRQTEGGAPTGLELEVERLTVRWRPLQLLSRGLEVDSIEAAGVTVRTAPPGPEEPSDESLTLPDLRLPVSVHVEAAEVRPLAVIVPPAAADAEPRRFTLDRIALADLRIAPAGGPLSIASLSASAAEAALEVSGSLTPTGDYPFELETSWRAVTAVGEQDGGAVELRGSGGLRGTLREIGLEQEISARARTADPDTEPGLDGSVAGIVADPFGTPRADLEIRWQRLRWPLSGELLAESQGDVRVSGTLERIRIEGMARAGGPELPAAELTLHGETDLASLTAESIELRTLGSVITGHGRLAWEPQLTWTAELEGRDLDPAVQWPEWPGDLSGRFTGSGTVDEQGVAHTDARFDRVRGTLRGYPVSADAAFVAHGDTIETLSLDARSGDSRLVASGSAGERLDLTFELEIPDLVQVLPEASGSLAARGRLAGERAAPAIDARIRGAALAWRDYRLADLDGELDGVLAGGGEVRANLSASRLEVGELVGRSVELELEGTVAEPLEAWSTGSVVRARFAAAELEAGAVRARGIAVDLDGTLGEHRIVLAADSAGQRGGDETAQRLRLRAEGGLAGEPRPTRWSGSLEELSLDAASLGSWALDSEIPVVVSPEQVALGAGCWRRDQDGERPSFVCGEARWSADAPWTVVARLSNLPLGLVDPLLGEGRELRGALDGAVEASGVGAVVEAANLRLDRVEGALRVDLPENGALETPFRAGEGELDLGPDGLRVRFEVGLPDQDGEVTARVELPGYATAEGWAPADEQPLRGTVSASLAELAVLQTFLPQLRDPRGALEAEIELSGTVGAARLEGRVALRDASGRIAGLAAEGSAATLDLEFTDATLDARVDEAGARFDLALRTQDPAGTVRGDVELPGYRLALAAPPADQRLSGSIEIALDGIAPVAALLPEISDVTGELDGTFTLAGTLGDPQIEGRADLTGFTGRIDVLAVDLTEGEAHLRGRAGESLELTASVRSGPGTLEAAGTVSNQPDGWQAEIRLTGSEVAVANTPEVRVRATPDLTLTLAQDTFDVRGDVLLPWARIEIKELPERAVEPSTDVVRVDLPPSEPAPLETETRITGRVRVTFGDDFQFEGFGFDVDPRGSILITDTGRGSTTATGQLVLENGRYRAYGQNLQIESGRVLFGGGPIQNPSLSVEAYRTVGTVKAGVRVGGTLERPVATLTSEPAMSESDVLHYMMLGRAPGEVTSSSEDELLVRAATSLGIRGGNLIARQLAARYSIDQLGIETEGGVDTASLVVGKYLSPRLYVSYGIGLFEAISTITLRYVLSSKWTLTAEKGRGTGADLVYTIERGRRRPEIEPGERPSPEEEPPPR